jgi:hypothetical protein
MGISRLLKNIVAMKSKLVFFIYLYTHSIYSQGIKFVDQNNNLLINHKLTISQESLILERLTDSIGIINLNGKLFDFSKPIDFKPLGFISNKLIVENDTLLTFITGNLQLDEVIISNGKKKEVDFQNFKQKENRLSWILQNQHNVRGSLAPNYEYITLIDQFDFEVNKTEFKEVMFETINKHPHLDILITYRLNIYNENKELIYSQELDSTNKCNF